MSMAKVYRMGMNLDIHFDGLDDLVLELDNMIDAVDDELKRGLNEYAALAEEGSKALTFKDYGDLEESINAEPARMVGGVWEASVGSNMVYALRRHEEQYKPGVRPKYDRGIKIENYYVDGRGRRTRVKPNWRGQPPGRKFISRAVQATEKDFEEIMDEALQNVLKGRRGRLR